MKKIYALFLASVLTLGIANASHLMGGDITSRNIGGLTYETTLTAFRDTTGIPMYPSATFTYLDATGAVVFTKNPQVSVATNIGNGVEMYTYKDTVTFLVAGNYKITWNDCCRNMAILNLPNPVGNSLYLDNQLMVSSSNSSPMFLNLPVTLAQVNVPFIYNPMPFDIDGDSMSWQLDIPYDYTSSLGVPIGGYTNPPSDPLMPFTINAVTGEISFQPNALGHFVTSVLVKEYRNGVQIGSIRRDMQFIVVASDNEPDSLEVTSNIIPAWNGAYYANNVNGTNITFSAVAKDPNTLDFITIKASGEPFIVANSPATYTVLNGNGTANINIIWNTLPEHARARPYIVTIRTTEFHSSYQFVSDKTMLIYVGVLSSIKEEKNLGSITLFPNPSNSSFVINTSLLKPELCMMNIVDATGKLVYTKQVLLQNGQNINVSDLKLANGLYNLQLSNSNFKTNLKMVIEK